MTLALDRPILLVGGGNMGAALAEGWLAGGLPADRLLVQDPASTPILDGLTRRGATVRASFEDIGAVSAVVLSVKPQVLDAVAPTVARLAALDAFVLSVAAGKRIDGLARHFPAGTAIVRAMPNTPAAVGRGMTVLCKNAHVSPEQERIAGALMSAVGDTAWIADESLMDAVTAVSGSGPAYVFLMAEALAAAAEAAGLDPQLAARLSRRTIAGAGEMLARSSEPAGALRANVTSPGGVTAAALSVLMAPDGLEALLKKAVAAATARSRELDS